MSKQLKTQFHSLGWPDGGFDPEKRDACLRDFVRILAGIKERKQRESGKPAA